MKQCKKCGIIVDNDKDMCVDCFHKEFFELDKPLKESKKPQSGLLKGSTVLVRAIAFLFKTVILAIGVLAILTYFIPTFDNRKDKDLSWKQEKIALNCAATVAQISATYYSNSNKDSTHFIGMKTDYGKLLYIDKGYSVQLPDDYRCDILDSIVVVTHKDGAKAEVRWR